MLIGGLIIMGVSTGSLFFITSNAIWIWEAIIHNPNRSAIIEILRDSYFYKKIDGRMSIL